MFVFSLLGGYFDFFVKFEIIFLFNMFGIFVRVVLIFCCLGRIGFWVCRCFSFVEYCVFVESFLVVVIFLFIGVSIVVSFL